jgi:hypothetical protein
MAGRRGFEREVGLREKLELVDSSKAGRVVIGWMRRSSSVEEACAVGSERDGAEGFCLAVGQRWEVRNEANGLADPRGHNVRVLRLDRSGISALWRYLRTLLQRRGRLERVGARSA